MKTLVIESCVKCPCYNKMHVGKICELFNIWRPDDIETKPNYISPNCKLPDANIPENK